ncbi:MAG: asparagine synthase (glutamine-hydrolyzing) [Desulfobacterales bacterium]
MCGICGYIDLGNGPVPVDRIRSMCTALAARGPDDAGVHLSEDHAAGLHVGLGHRRLAIIDFSPAAHQPMANEDGTIRLTYNGEIYNYKELRRELEAKGHRFRSDSDTEVVIHLYEEEGLDAVKRFNGMFAFGLWDEKRQRLWLCRDRIGIKPLVYSWDGSRLLFASEIKALLTDIAVDRRLDRQALMLYLAFNYVPAPLTMFQGIRKLEPGCSLVLEDGKVAISRYWSLPRVAEDPGPVDAGRIKHRLIDALSEAVAGCMLADVPVGAFLSGGIDSGVVVALMARLSAQPVKTFTIGFADDGLYDETTRARRVVAMYGTDHHEIRISQRDMLDVLPEVLGALDEPFADSSAIPTYLVSRETRRHVKVALSGDGGDELFAGYRCYLAEYWRARYRMVPALLREAIIEPVIAVLPDSRETRTGEILRRAKKFIRAASGPFDERLLALKEVFPASVRRTLLAGASNGTDPALAWVQHLLTRSSGDSINRMLVTDLIDSLPGDMLAKVDLMSMANSLEVRVPLLDHRVVELAFAIQGSQKLRGGVTKRLLKETFQDLLPPGHTRQPKSGFEIPISLWLRTDVSFLVDRYLSSERIRDQGIFDYDIVHGLVCSHRAGTTDTSWMLWNLIVFENWMERYACT